MTRKSALVGLGLVAAGGLAVTVALSRCSGPEQRHVETAPEAESAVSPSEERSGEADGDATRAVGKSIAAPDPSGNEADEPESDELFAPSGTASASVPAASGSAGSSIARALKASDPADLALLGRIERELKRDPPPEVHAMLRRRAEGATRDELLGMARALPELQLRVLVLRWVDEVRPATATGGAQKPAVPTPGSAPPLVKPIEPKR